MTVSPTRNTRAPEVYPTADKEKEPPADSVDYRSDNGPLLTYLRCENETLSGQSLYLGAEIGSDNRIYFIPGHAPRVLVCDPETDKVTQIGPTLPGKFKWLRGVRHTGNDIIYGLPCHADSVLRIHVPTGEISTIPIPYDEFYSDPIVADKHRKQEWKYHGGCFCPLDGCCYLIPQSALHVLKIDPITETCELVGPPLEGRFKWYGGVIGKTDGALYGIPHNSSHVLRIHPSAITLHGDFGTGGHKWHGASAAPDGTIVCVPANADTVLCITPGSPEPTWTELGDAGEIQTGRHRKDSKYKYLGALAGTDGKVYCFPCGSERVLQIDTQIMTVKAVGANIYDDKMERLCQNKWQNGIGLGECIYAIPLAAESLLRLDCSKDPPEVTTWHLPSPYKGLAKWEGGVVAHNGVMYTVPNNCKAILRIEPAASTPTTGDEKAKAKASRDSKSFRGRDKPDDQDGLVYRSGIPTLRSSAHRVKFKPNNRKNDPKPRNRARDESDTPWLPKEVRAEEVFAYDESLYDLKGAVVSLLKRCSPDIVGSFVNDSERLEDFTVPAPSVWRSVNGGRCEDAQKYLSSEVVADDNFREVFDRLVTEVALPFLKRRLVAAGAVSDEEGSVTFYYQSPPTLRLQPGPAWAQVRPHNDAEYGHQNGELNFWLPLTDRELTGVDLHCETAFKADDYHPIPAKLGEIISFHGSSCRHYVNANATTATRLSMDFRVGVEGFFDPYWQMQGTTDDHDRQEAKM